MSLSIYDIGDAICLTFSMADAPSEAPVLTVLQPDCTEITPTVIATDMVPNKAWKASFLIDQDGQSWYRWSVGGTIPAAEESSFLVRKQRVA